MRALIAPTVASLLIAGLVGYAINQGVGDAWLIGLGITALAGLGGYEIKASRDWRGHKGETK